MGVDGVLQAQRRQLNVSSLDTLLLMTGVKVEKEREGGREAEPAGGQLHVCSV